MVSLPIFLIPVLVGLLSQFSKRFFNSKWMTGVKVQGLNLPRYGGMPSAHTAFATSLVTILGLVDGIASGTFAIGVAFWIFILDDALRMRIFLGQQGQALTKLIRRQPDSEQHEYPKLETKLGHKPLEVLAGALLGFFLTVALYWIFWM